MPNIWCENCRAVREMSIHGRCSCCDSSAIDIPVRPARIATPTIEELEKLYEESK